MGSRALRHWLTQPRRERAGRDRSATTRSPRCSAHGARRAARRAARRQRRRAHHRAHRAAPGAPARARRPARDARQALPQLRAGPAGEASLLLDMLARGAARRRPSCVELLAAAIADEPAALLRDGGVIATGHDAELDELRAISENCDAFLLELEARERAAHRHRQPARAVQPRARLLHRGHAGRRLDKVPGRLPAPPDAEERRALHHARAEGLRGQGAVGAGARAGAREVALRAAARRARSRISRALSAAGARAGDARRAGALAERAHTLRLVPRRSSSREPCIEIERGRHPVVEARLAENAARRLHRQRLPARRAAAACWSSPARTWAASRPTCARSR